MCQLLYAQTDITGGSLVHLSYGHYKHTGTGSEFQGLTTHAHVYADRKITCDLTVKNVSNFVTKTE